MKSYRSEVIIENKEDSDSLEVSNLANTITVTELTQNLSEILDRVFKCGEEFTVTRDGAPVAKLVSPKSPDSIENIMARVGGFKMPGDGFADDLEKIQTSQPKWDTA